MFTFEKNGVRMSVESDIQASAFLSCGWKPVEETAKKAQAAESKPKTVRQTKK
jgi:hypothetical protein